MHVMKTPHIIKLCVTVVLMSLRLIQILEKTVHHHW